MPLEERIVRKRRTRYTVTQLADLLGVSPKVVRRIEREGAEDLLKRYLSLVGYHIAYYPQRKGQG